MAESQDNVKEAQEIRIREHRPWKEFHKQILEDQRSSAQRAWRKQLNKIENRLADSSDSTILQSERMFLETKMEILVEAHECLDSALEDDVEAKRLASEKFETWEREHSDALKLLNHSFWA